MLMPSSTFEQSKATQEENTSILHCKTTCYYRATSPSTSTTLEAPTILHSLIQSGLIPGGKDVKKGKHAMFFTAVNPMFIHLHKQWDYDETKTRIAVYKHNWKIHQNTVYWSNLRVAQKKGLQFNQTRSNVVILYNTFLPMCIGKVVLRKSGEKLYSETYQSPVALQRVVLKPNLHCER